MVDIAAGHGRYVLDALANEPAVSDILLRDYSELNVAQGQEMIAQRGMSGRVRFEQGDAFNPEELSALTPRPTLAIVSGLYELFPENEQVKTPSQVLPMPSNRVAFSSTPGSRGTHNWS